MKNQDTDINEFIEYHSKLPDEELVKIAYFELRKYKKEARVSAKKILKQRGLSKKQIELLKNNIRRRKQKERREKLKDKNEDYGFADFILDLIFYR